MTWSEAFDAYLTKNDINGSDAARDLGKSPSTILYWRRGSVPHNDDVLKAVETWSGGKVKASLASRAA